MSLQDIEQEFATAAKAEWVKIEAAGIAIGQEIKADAISTFQLLTQQFAPLVMSTISNLATTEFAALSSGEKQNLAATTVVDKAAQSGVTILAADATALIKNGFEAFKAAAPTLLPSGLVDSAAKALDAAEGAVEAAVGKAADSVSSKL